MTIPSSGSPGQGRQIGRALAISLVLHAWLLYGNWPQPSSPHAAGVLQATLRPLLASPAPASADLPAPAAAHAVPPPAAPPGARPAPAVTAAVAERAPGETTATAPNAVSTASGADRSGGTERGPSAAATGYARGQGGEGADADGLRQYRLALAREAGRFKRYPERALLAGIGGTAEVRVELGNGMAPVARLVRSSGDESLDTAALSMMRSAAPRTAVPEALRGRNFAVNLPVVFDVSAE